LRSPASQSSGSEPRQVVVTCADGTALAGRLFEPDAPERAIVIHGATGVPRDYYARFAAWLSGVRNAAVLIYDYRDCGESAAGPTRAAKATMGVWGVEDQGAALGFLAGRYPELPLEVIGHSLGGMFLNFHQEAERVRRLTAVASGPANWRRHPASFTPLVLAFWFGVGPVLTRALGYTPGRMLGLGADLPAGVYWQWRRWCTSRPFYRVDWGAALPVPDLERVRCPVRLVGIADDPMITPAVVRDLAQFYPRAPIEHLVISPADAGTPKIGHLRIFSERSRAAWPILAG
jgi:predicted alpha/beta hydrolase